ELMHSAAGVSETQLGHVAVERLGSQAPARVLIGGLGLGFTLHAVLERVGTDAIVNVVELMPEVVEWNRTWLEKLNGWRLSDRRVIVEIADVGRRLQQAQRAEYDAIVLDVDNGPTAMVGKANAGLYTDSGIQVLKRALKPGGRAAIWSARADPTFESRLKGAGFRMTVTPAKLHANARRSTYVLYFGDLQES
ncbi:MAG: spermine synthase, partial [Opitutus sp.]